MSTADAIALLNRALTSTGHDPITSFEDGSAEAEVSSSNYESMVRAELTKYPWSFAEQYTDLNRIEGATPIGRWSYVYQLDLSLMKLVDVQVNGFGIPYERKGSRVYTNSSEGVKALWVSRTDEKGWPYDFQQAMQTRFEALFYRALAEDFNEGEARDSRADTQFKRADLEDSKNRTPRKLARSSRLAGVRRG